MTVDYRQLCYIALRQAHKDSSFVLACLNLLLQAVISLTLEIVHVRHMRAMRGWLIACGWLIQVRG